MSSLGKKLPSCITAPIATSGLYGAPILRDTTISNLAPILEAITSPVTTPLLGIAKMINSLERPSINNFNFSASLFAASILFLNIHCFEK